MVVVSRMAKSINLVNMGFGISVGIFSARMIFILVLIAFFILMYILFKMDSSEKEKSTRTIRARYNLIISMGISVAMVALIAAGFADGYMMRKEVT